MLSLYTRYAVAVGHIRNSLNFIAYFIVFIRHSLCSEKRRIERTKSELFGVLLSAEQNVPKITAHFPPPRCCAEKH